MKAILTVVVLLLILARPTSAAESVAAQFLRYIYGAGDVNLTQICVPSDDVWMLPGATNAAALQAIAAEKLDATKQDGILSGVIRYGQGQDLYFVELRGGKVDPTMNLDGIYMIHRQIVLRFLMAALTRDNSMLDRFVTDRRNLDIVGPKAARGDMDVYGEVISSFPVVRSSKPADDAKSKTITYRVPLGDKGLLLTLKKEGSTWKIDTGKKLTVPMEYFFREN